MQTVTVGGPVQQRMQQSQLSPMRSRVIEIPARQIEIPSKMMELPARQIQITGDDGQPVTVEVPARMIEIPGRVLEVPGRAVDVADGSGENLVIQESPQQVIETAPAQETRGVEYVSQAPQQQFVTLPQQQVVYQQPEPATQQQHVYFEQSPASYEQIYGEASSPTRTVEQVAPLGHQFVQQQFVQQPPQQAATIVIGGNTSPPASPYMSSFQSILQKGTRRELKPVYEPAPIDYDINAVRALTSAYNQVNAVRSVDTEGNYNYISGHRQQQDARKVRDARNRAPDAYSPSTQWTVGR